MLVVAAVIAGGTAMTGGRGSVALSVAALLLLNGLTNGLSLLGASKSVKLVAQGLVLAAIIVYDAWRQAQRERVRGQRQELLAELASRPEPTPEGANEPDEQGSATMQPRQPDRTFAMVCVTAMACVAIVAIYAIWSHGRGGAPATGPAATLAARAVTGPEAGKAGASGTDVAQLKATDGQPLVWIDDQPLDAPKRPANLAALADDDLLRWYDSEFSGWNARKLPQPRSPGDGPQGKRVVALQYMDHPYWQGYSNGMKRQAQRYGIKLTIMEAGNDNKVQMDQVEQAIEIKPDMVIITPVDANGVVPMLKRLHDSKMPTIASNLLPVDVGMKYVICWTGPDDWGQFRMLAREFAKAMGNEGAYCVVRHVAGTSCYLSRTWGAVSELKRIAPKMLCLDMQTTDLQTDKTKTQVAVWLKKYGQQLKGIVSADDSKAMVGIVEALADAGRTDVICVAAGASRTGLNYIKDGKLHAVTYQSAEADGALPIEMAARWFRGEAIKRPVYYLQKHIITAADVDQYMPAQW
jgi:ribose transport system substrate-binding protein